MCMRARATKCLDFSIAPEVAGRLAAKGIGRFRQRLLQDYSFADLQGNASLCQLLTTINIFNEFRRSHVPDLGSIMGDVCDRILAQDGRIGFAMVVDEKGQIVESKMRGTPLMPKEDIAAFAGVWTSVMGGVARQMQKYLGTNFGLSIYYSKLNIH